MQDKGYRGDAEMKRCLRFAEGSEAVSLTGLSGSSVQRHQPCAQTEVRATKGGLPTPIANCFLVFSSIFLRAFSDRVATDKRGGDVKQHFSVALP